ncbi:hypothetical protein ACFYMW_39555 [Streptomyces sp. NPDC006692]|uniref:hypothetical protein n=1 Tax=unclassified Streptomyces TaxID=2593676 RepID=UPI00367556FD
MTHPQHLAAADAAELKEIRTACPHLDAAARHAEMLHSLQEGPLPDWMDRVLADDLLPCTPWSAAYDETSTPSLPAFPPHGAPGRSSASAHFWPHDPATGTSRCEIA